MATTPLVRPVTSVGVVAVPPGLPSWPWVFSPQHFTPPEVVSAQVCAEPAATWATPELRPATFTGSTWGVPGPPPNCPPALLPQHLRSPAAVTAQLCRSPAETCTTPAASP